MPTSDGELLATVAAYRKAGSARTAAHDIGLHFGTVARRVRMAEARGLVPGMPTRKDADGRMTRVEFLARDDRVGPVSDLLQKTLAGLDGDEIVTDAEMREMHGTVGYQTWKKVANMPGFTRFHFLCDGKRWWAHPDTVIWILEHVKKARPSRNPEGKFDDQEQDGRSHHAKAAGKRGQGKVRRVARAVR